MEYYYELTLKEVEVTKNLRTVVAAGFAYYGFPVGEADEDEDEDDDDDEDSDDDDEDDDDDDDGEALPGWRVG